MKAVILLGLVASSISKDDFSSEAYQKQSAQTKIESLWQKIVANTKSLEWYGTFTAAGILVESYAPSFDETGDVFPHGRKKLIHTVGVVAKAKWIPENNPYTGVFQGCQNLLVRLSVAKKFDTTKSTAEGAYNNFAPGIAVKCLRTGVPSSNIIAMYSTNGQSSWNFFKNDFTNYFRIPEKGDTQITLLASRFTSISYWISSLGVKDLAEFNEEGVKTQNPKFPFRLIFRPNKELQKNHTETFTEEFTEQLKRIPENTNIYEVFAEETPDCPEVKIGTIQITTPLTTSNFGDESLFFRHNRIELDHELHPTWPVYRDSVEWGLFSGLKLTPAKSIQKKQSCPFAHLF